MGSVCFRRPDEFPKRDLRQKLIDMTRRLSLKRVGETLRWLLKGRLCCEDDEDERDEEIGEPKRVEFAAGRRRVRGLPSATGGLVVCRVCRDKLTWVE